MLLARYGGGLDVARVNDVLKMPMSMIVRFMGAAKVAVGGKRTLGARPAGDDEAMAQMLDERVKQLQEKEKKA